MHLTNLAGLPFNRFLPIYNWLYPLTGKRSKRFSGIHALDVLSALQPARGRALYLHIPFCETICTFCPFVRGGYRDPSIIDAYVDALETEIRIKASYPLVTDPPVRSIFVGGGTPSLLEPDHIRRIGAALAQHFDLSQLTEFSFECEVKSVTPERIGAMREIGVTHARFGLQTFSPEYRRLFNLTSTIDQIERATTMFSDAFPYVSCDILYGMNGETVDELRNDLNRVCDLGLRNIDIYPINNVVTQPKLHASFADEGLAPTSGLTKFYMNIYVRETMRERGYLPHNGHGYVKVPKDELDGDPVVTDRYSFVYHEHVYGYPGYDLLGFGTNAVSSFEGFSITNAASRNGYIASLADGIIPMTVRKHEHDIDACRPLALSLPYHGAARKEWIDWPSLHESAWERLQRLIAHGLVAETSNAFELTRTGWEWYSSVMHYLLPPAEQSAVDTIIHTALHDERRTIESSGIEIALPEIP
ncbi:MAG TPA: radical SAM protein [Candidatus Kapabacteria bacterium]|nr:radical SAM protein [Candidatus Kapabacteria bacterium]